MRHLLLLSPVLLLAAACQSPATPSTAVQPTFDDIEAKVFSSSCSTRSCHSVEGGKGGLVLTADKAYDQLVGVLASNTAAAAKGKKRVVPGDPDNSFLMQKLTGPAADEGDQMPDRGTTTWEGAAAACMSSGSSSSTVNDSSVIELLGIACTAD